MTTNHKPNFIVIGAQKSGTTWLQKQLKSHPDFFMSEPKELNFFNNAKEVNDPARLSRYYANFDGAKGKAFIGEATPHYFWRMQEGSPFSNFSAEHDTAIALHEALGPDLLSVVSLRDPVSRAVSAYYHNYAVGRNPEKRGIFWCNPSMGIVDLGFYKRHWEHYARVFSPDNICTVLYDDITKSPAGYLRKVLRFLKADEPDGYMDSLDLNEKLNYRARLLQRRTSEERANLPVIQPQEVAALLELYSEDIKFVSELTKRPLPHWSDLDTLIAKHCPKDTLTKVVAND